jgi:hypothetical protein
MLMASSPAAQKAIAAMKVHKGQKIVMTDRRRFRVVVAGRRWGKTQVSKISIIISAAAKPGQLVWYVAPTYQRDADGYLSRQRIAHSPQGR